MPPGDREGYVAMETASLVTVALFLSIYGWLATIEAGVGLARIFPNAASADRPVRLFTPLLGLADLFLVFGAAGFGLLFTHLWSWLPAGTSSIVLMTGGVVVFRMLLLTWLFYTRAKTGHTIGNYLFVLVNLCIPIGLGAAGIALLVGKPFWQDIAGWALFATLVAGVCALSVSFVTFMNGSRARGSWIHAAGRFWTFAFGVVGGVILVQVLRKYAPHLLTLPFAYFSLLSAAVVLWLGVAVIARREWRTWWYLSIVALTGPLLLALANYPYAVFPDRSLQQAYSAHGYGDVVLLGFAVLSPAMFIGLAFLGKLLFHERGDRDR